jgi:hypothetical protein
MKDLTCLKINNIVFAVLGEKIQAFMLCITGHQRRVTRSQHKKQQDGPAPGCHKAALESHFKQCFTPIIGQIEKARDSLRPFNATF